jgi:putative transposase
MAAYRRMSQPGATWFFTLTTEQRKPLLTQPQILRAMTVAPREVYRRDPFELVAWVVLPDHLHVIARLPEGDSAYARRISIFKRLVSQRVSNKLVLGKRESTRKRRESGLWQRRFWEHMIRDEADLHRHIDYIHYNPVKHGHARSAAAWAYSSFHGYMRAGVLPPDWAAEPEQTRLAHRSTHGE